MHGLHLFIAGIEKTGTTSLADWLVSSGFAKYRVAGVKEPYTYASSEAPTQPEHIPDGVLLDASVGYCFDPKAIARMPAHPTKIVLCLRNHFDRCYSAYSNHRAIASRDETSVAFARTLPGQVDIGPEDFFEGIFAIHKRYYSADAEMTIRRYFEEQAKNVCSQSFKERVKYEIAFFLRRRTYPFFSILDNAFYVRALKNILLKYRAEDILLLTLDQLESEEKRAEFIQDLLGENVVPNGSSRSIPRYNSTAAIGLDKDKPDFQESEWDFLRDLFLQDLLDFRTTAHQAGVSMKYVNPTSLDQYLIDPSQ